MKRLLALTLAAVLVPVLAGAQETPKVGILPFDVISVEGAGWQAGSGIARALRLEIIKGRQATPVLLELQSGQRPPIEVPQAATIGASGGLDLVVLGTVVEATTSQSNTGANTGRVMGGVNVGGRLRRANAKVLLYVQLVDPVSREVVRDFEAEGSETDVGVGANVWTAMGSANTNDDSWLNTPTGKAIRKAAEKVAAEVAQEIRNRRE